MHRALIAIAISLSLVGCGKHYWNKPGTSFADFSQDSRECAQENAIYMSGDKSYGIVRPELYRACMRGRGWVRAQHPDPPPGWFRGIEGDDVVKLDAPPPQPHPALVPPVSNLPPTDPTLAGLIGSWTGTLTGPGPAPSGRRAYPATLRISPEGDQLRWSLEVSGADLGGSGFVVSSPQGTSFSGRLGHPGAPTSFAVTVVGSALEANGLGTDNWVYRLAVQRQ
jgi:hypothetical protein